jgi:hypothetical protein
VAVDSAGAYESRKIDLVETFNYLIGLRVKHIDTQVQRGFTTVTGTLPSGETCLVLWRDCDLLNYEGIAKLCEKLAINPADNEFDVVYINGDNNIPNRTDADGRGRRCHRVLKLRPDRAGVSGAHVLGGGHLMDRAPRTAARKRSFPSSAVSTQPLDTGVSSRAVRWRHSRCAWAMTASRASMRTARPSSSTS